jgi:hypothetical protein
MLFSFQFSWIFDGAGEAIFRGQQHIPGGGSGGGGSGVGGSGGVRT